MQRWTPTDEQQTLILNCVKIGLSEEKLAYLLDIAPVTYQRALKKNAALRDAVLKARAAASQKVLETAWDRATSGREEDTAMLIFWLKCREGWKPEPDRVEVSGRDGKPIESQVQFIVNVNVPSNGREIRELNK